MKIYKYVLGAEGYQDIEMPSGARILSVGNQRGTLCIWAMVNPLNTSESRSFEVVGTGWLIGRDLLKRSFLGTVVADPFVWHVFEVGA